MKIIALIIGLSLLPTGNAIADIAPVSPSSAPCKCKTEKLVFGKDKYQQWVTLLPATVKKISDYSAEFTFLLNSREVGTQVRCQGSRLKLFKYRGITGGVSCTAIPSPAMVTAELPPQKGTIYLLAVQERCE